MWRLIGDGVIEISRDKLGPSVTGRLPEPRKKARPNGCHVRMPIGDFGVGNI